MEAGRRPAGSKAAASGSARYLTCAEIIRGRRYLLFFRESARCVFCASRLADLGACEAGRVLSACCKMRSERFAASGLPSISIPLGEKLVGFIHAPVSLSDYIGRIESNCAGQQASRGNGARWVKRPGSIPGRWQSQASRSGSELTLHRAFAEMRG